MTAPTYIDEVARRIAEAEEGGTLDYDNELDRPLCQLYALLALAKGEEVTAEDVHDAWAIWTLGCRVTSHPSLVPFEELDPEIRALDEPYVEAIRKVARELDRG